MSEPFKCAECDEWMWGTYCQACGWNVPTESGVITEGGHPMTTDTAPDAGHAAETMSDEELIDRLIDAAVVAAQTREAIRWEHGAEAKADLQLAFNRERKTLERRKAEALRRMHTAPARTAGMERGEAT